MEKKSISSKDILRMDGLLPPMRRQVSVIDNNKRKGKKYKLINSILRRISAIRDCDTSSDSNEETMLYSRKVSKSIDYSKDEKKQGKVTRAEEKASERMSSMEKLEGKVTGREEERRQESMDGKCRKIRKNKLKARAEAKREQIISKDSSSDEDRTRSSSLTKIDHSPRINNSMRLNDQDLQKESHSGIKIIAKVDEPARTEERINNYDNNKKNNRKNGKKSNKRNSVDSAYPVRPMYDESSMHYLYPTHPMWTVHPRQPVQERSFVNVAPNSAYPKYITDLNENVYAKPLTIRNSYHEDYEKCRNDGNCINYTEAEIHENYGTVCENSNCNLAPPKPPPRDPRYRGLTTCSTRYARQQQYLQESGSQMNGTGKTSNELRVDAKLSNNKRENLARNVMDGKREEAVRFERMDGIMVRDDAAAVEGEEEEEEEEVVKRKRSSKNLEEALSELEAIYNSLRLGDEDLLDRAERRSMQEFTERQVEQKNRRNMESRKDEENWDRSRDDMAYRRMHREDRAKSFSEIISQSNMSRISYLSYRDDQGCPLADNPRENLQNISRRRSKRSNSRGPDIRLDDLLYRSINHSRNTPKVVEPQPPFGIPLGPVTTAPETDYLHTKPTKSMEHVRSAYIPQREPDIVTDDLAFRTLRKDSIKDTDKKTVRNTVAGGNTVPGRKKKAVRSLSANLYGLIDQDRIHLRSLEEIQDMTRTQDEHNIFSRVASETELSDCSLRNSTDINGNHPSQVGSGVLQRRKLRVYVSPGDKTDDWDTSCNYVIKDNESNKDVEELSVYARLCQDLVNLIEGPNQPNSEVTEPERGDESPDKHVDVNIDVDRLTEALITGPDEKEAKEDQGSDNESKLDFYLRLADENVKMIAEAFGNVADHLSDARVAKVDQTDGIDVIVPKEEGLQKLERGEAESSNDVWDLKEYQTARETQQELSKLQRLEKWENPQSDKTESKSEAEIDLSRAVQELRIAAASLYEHESEMVELESRLQRSLGNELQLRNSKIENNIDSTGMERLDHVQLQGGEEQEQEEEKEEAKTTEEGENKTRSGVDLTMSLPPDGVRVSYVTNLITIMITTYSMVFLCCFVALILASIAAS